MAIHKVTIRSTSDVPLTIATTAVKKAMNWDFFRANEFCQEAGKSGSSILCITTERKAKQIVEELSHTLPAECFPL